MTLKFPGEWRFRPPAGVNAISNDAINEFYDLITKIGAQTDSWDNLELFKGEFAAVVGSMHFRSSNESWAVTDLFSNMERAAQNPPLFYQALYGGFQYSRSKLGLAIPDDALVNEINRKYSIPFEISGDELHLTLGSSPPVPIPPPPPSLQETTAQLLQESISRSEQLLIENRGREAVQELLWVIESLVTGFRGISLPTGQIKGNYFNQIVRELKKGNPNTTLERAIEWCEQLHGFLSSPTGGRVRHGLDLSSGTPLPVEDARFFCNLIRSFVGFFQSEYQKTRSVA